MKWLGCALALCACGWLGWSAARELKLRVAQLRAVLAALEEMERELRCRLTPMPELLAGLGERTPGEAGRFFARCAAGMEELDGPFSLLWDRALAESGLSLTEEDRRVLGELGGTLGRYDAASQCAAIGQVRSRLAGNLAAAVERRDRLGRVYGVLGLSAGAALVILLL